MGKTVAVKLGDALVQGLEQYCKKYGVGKSEAIRRALRDLLTKTVWNQKEAESG